MYRVNAKSDINDWFARLILHFQLLVLDQEIEEGVADLLLDNMSREMWEGVWFYG